MKPIPEGKTVFDYKPEELQTREGEEILGVFKTNLDALGHEVLVVVRDKDALTDTIHTCYNGSYFGDHECELDVVLKPKKLSGHLNYFKNGVVEGWKTREDADKFASEDRVACIDLSQFEEGEGL